MPKKGCKKGHPNYSCIKAYYSLISNNSDSKEVIHNMQNNLIIDDIKLKVHFHVDVENNLCHLEAP